MAFNYLPNEIKEKILLYAIDYTPALKMVSKLWREIISHRGFNEWISFKDLVRRGDVDLLIDLHKRKEKDHDCSLLIYAAFYGREELCHLAKRWGESNFEGMLYAATQGGHKIICQIARAWGAKGVGGFHCSVEKAGCEHFYPRLLRIPGRIAKLERKFFYDGKHKDLQSIVKEWELNDTELLFSVQNDSKTGNTYVIINKLRRPNSKPKDLWSDGGSIIVVY